MRQAVFRIRSHVSGKAMAVKDKEFGRKIDILEGAVGFRFPIHFFSNQSLADLLGVPAETMSRKKSGERPVGPSDWSRLVMRFQLAENGFEPDMWAADAETFREHLKLCKLGVYGGRDMDRARQLMLDLASPARRFGAVEPGSIDIEREPSLRAGGIGGVEKRPLLTVFRIGERVRLKIKVPDDGYLYLFNDYEAMEVALVTPSFFAPRADVGKGLVRLPDNMEFPFFPVAEPGGNYRLFAVWFRQRPTISFASAVNTEAGPRDLTDIEFLEFANAVRVTVSAGSRVMVAVNEYRVAIN